MSQNIVVGIPSESVYICARKMAFKKVSSVIIINEDSVVGILTEQDVARKVVAEGLVPKTTPVSTVMSSDITSINPYEDIESAIELMGKKGIKHLPVIEKGKLIGIITAKDIIAIEPVLLEMLKFNNTSNSINNKSR